MAREIRTVGVVGLGTMGAGITEVLARYGLAVIGVEISPASLERARLTLETSTARALARGKLSAEERIDLLGKVDLVGDLDALAGVDLVIEAVPEHLDLKREVFAKLDSLLGPGTILATNTSSLSVTELAVATRDPRRVLGMHFFNPAPVQGLVEVVRTVISDQAVVDAVVELVQRLGKEAVVVGDKAGFIANALLFGYLNHAVSMLEQRYASREDIDAAMRFGCGLPMGPLALMDLIGLDTAYEILDSMYKQSRDRLHAPSPVIKQMVTAGLKGRKSGRGFYRYQSAGSSTVVDDHLTPVAASVPTAIRSIQAVGVIGSGTMATGIVEVFAKSGFDVVFVARGEQKVAAVLAAITKSLDRARSKGRLTADARTETLARITGTTALDDLADADLVLEAVVEDLAVKQSLFTALDEICKPGAILATTTSSLPVIDCAAVTARPHDVIGIHFFNPAR
jgi:3-hydroxybutyryl-CoA dehydrogenase